MKTGTKQMIQNGVIGIAAGLAVRSLWRSLTAYRFHNRVVVITGGSRGLGLLMARELAKEGASLAICARNPQEIESATRELEGAGAFVFSQVCDLRDPEQIVQFLNDAQKKLGPVDVLINNAGVIQVGPIEHMTQKDVEEAMDVHFWAVYHATNAVVPRMKERGGGRIVNIASIGGEIAIPHMMPYSASKFALVGYSHALRAELAKDGIIVTTICPGLMRTGSPRNALFKGKHRDEYTWFSIGGSLPGLSMNAQRAARQILNACRHGASHVTLSLPAQCAATLNGIAPGLVSRLASVVNRVLPGTGGIRERSLPGSQSFSRWSPSMLTTLNEQASRENNEILQPRMNMDHP